MQSLKHYFACDHRMNRKPYVLIFVVYFVLALAVGMTAVGASTAHMQEIVELANAHQAGTISQEVYTAKMAEIQMQIRASIPLVTIVLGNLLILGFLPALVMRLKDLGWLPLLALLVLVKPTEGLLARFTGTMILPSSLGMLIGGAVLIGELLLIFMPGTKGPNRYGEDPIKR